MAFEPYSPKDAKYNCLSLVLKVHSLAIWPDNESPSDNWPSHIPNERTVAAIEALLCSLGFTSVRIADIDDRKVLVAIQAADGEPTHVAVKIPGSEWHSKLNQEINLYHETHLITPLLGTVAAFMEMSVGDYHRLSEEGVLSALQLQPPSMHQQMLDAIRQMGERYSNSN